LNQTLKKLGEFVLAMGLLVMVVMVFGNVVLRYGFDSGITFSEEVSRFIFVWITFIGAVLAFAQRGHIAMENLISKLPPSGKRLALILSSCLMLMCCGLLISGSFSQAVINIRNFAPVSGIPKGAIYAAGTTAGIALAAMLIRDLYRLLTGAPVEEFQQHAESE
jgi:TRAP-type C4-dicarboxylate transport system permease small subunit